MLDKSIDSLAWRFVCVEKFQFPGTLEPTYQQHHQSNKQLVTLSLTEPASIKDLLEYLKKSMGEQAWRWQQQTTLGFSCPYFLGGWFQKFVVHPYTWVNDPI